MKKLSYYILSAVLLLSVVSCSDFFETDSNSVIKIEDNSINTQRSAFYEMCGILHQLQKVADSYVIFGELRGDLMTVTENSSEDLRDINDFEVDSLNNFHYETDLYALINNCNYLITAIDTNLVVKEYKVLKYEMAQAKSIRAWAYMQLCTTYGEVYYYNDPILDSQKKLKYSTLKREALLDSLMTDLQPWVPADPEEAEFLPEYGSIGGFSSKLLFIPVRFMLGDLYMWKNDYENAAKMYYELMLTEHYLVRDLRNTWNGSTFTTVNGKNWTKLFTNYSSYNEMISIIPFTTDYPESSTALPDMFQTDYVLAPSQTAVDTWNNQTYAYDATVTKAGDLRGPYGSYETETATSGISESTYKSVTKYKNMDNYSIICRASTLYLRYAEAINRLGYSNTAFAMLKYGLTPAVLANTSYIPKTELPDAAIPYYLDFGQNNMDEDHAYFVANAGMHSRGCGTLTLFKSYSIEEGVDTLTWVENQLVTEMALETAFEGNRFQDLMRISQHRHNPAYLAQKVAAKYAVGKREIMTAKLSEEANWYLPHESK